MHNVSVIIPNYNGQHLLEQHLPAVLKMLQDGDEVLVVDDASTDTSVGWMRRQFSLKKTDEDIFAAEQKISKKTIFFRLLLNSRNQRFAASCNRGVKYSQHQLVFLLNTDVAPFADALKYLLPHFEDESVFGVGCLEEEPAGGKKVISGGKNRLWFERGLFTHSRAENFTSGETAWVSGGSGIFNKEKWLALRGFDVKYAPAYWEDVDLSFRARQRGWKVLFESRAKVAHNHESTNKDVFGQVKIMELGWKNGDYFTWKNGNIWQKIAYLLWKPYWMYARFQVRKKMKAEV